MMKHGRFYKEIELHTEYRKKLVQRIKEENLELFLYAVNFLGTVYGIKEFKQTIENFAKKIGMSIHYDCGCMFPNAYESWEKDEEGYFEDGVCFWYGWYDFSDDSYMDDETFVRYVELANEVYMELEGRDEELEGYVKMIREDFLGK